MYLSSIVNEEAQWFQQNISVALQTFDSQQQDISLHDGAASSQWGCPMSKWQSQGGPIPGIIIGCRGRVDNNTCP